MLRGPGAHPTPAGPNPWSHTPGRLVSRGPLGDWCTGELHSHHVGWAGGNEKRFLHSSLDRALVVGLAISISIDAPNQWPLRHSKILKSSAGAVFKR
jgi:hypothetical protein